jgi:ribosomal protein S18 acetylase RimI-like enzyme
MQIVVREAEAGDGQTVAKISAAAFAELRKVHRPAASAISARRNLASELTRLVAISENRVVGTLEYRQEDDRIHLIGLAVHPDFRRRGVARQLVSFLAGAARQAGATRLSLYAIRETGNVSVFEGLGFEVVREEVTLQFESDRFDVLNEVYMELGLSNRTAEGDFLRMPYCHPFRPPSIPPW